MSNVCEDWDDTLRFKVEDSLGSLMVVRVLVKHRTLESEIVGFGCCLAWVCLAMVKREMKRSKLKIV